MDTDLLGIFFLMAFLYGVAGFRKTRRKLYLLIAALAAIPLFIFILSYMRWF